MEMMIALFYAPICMGEREDPTQLNFVLITKTHTCWTRGVYHLQQNSRSIGSLPSLPPLSAALSSLSAHSNLYNTLRIGLHSQTFRKQRYNNHPDNPNCEVAGRLMHISALLPAQPNYQNQSEPSTTAQTHRVPACMPSLSQSMQKFDRVHQMVRGNMWRDTDNALFHPNMLSCQASIKAAI